MAADSSSSSNCTNLANETTTPLSLHPQQLSVNDLLHPSESAENLLETLSTEQLEIIEKALNKIKEKKLVTAALEQTLSSTSDTGALPLPLSPSSSTSVATSTNRTPSCELSAMIDDTTTQNLWTSAATQVAKALADAISSSASHLMQMPVLKQDASDDAKPPSSNARNSSTAPELSHEPFTEIREGVEWVSFVYSHHRTLRRYRIRTDLDEVDIHLLDENFKKENCVYPRANLPRETYRGNRWAYETECNILGWKLAWLNKEELAGKRGLIQRAVDSYRNRYPSMRSRRVARQEKLLKGTLRKRKQREEDEHVLSGKNSKQCIVPSSDDRQPKTITIEDHATGNKCRIRISIETVSLNAIDMAFRKNNCVFPRAISISSSSTSVPQRRLDEAKCNEIGWKLAWLNPRQLANKKNLLQHVLDTYRNQFMPDLRTRKYSSRVPPAPFTPPCPRLHENTTPLTTKALAEQQQQLANHSMCSTRRNSEQTCYTGSTATLDFRDCFSPPAEIESPSLTTELMLPPASQDLARHTDVDESSCQLSVGSTASQNPSSHSSPSPTLNIDDVYQQAALVIGSHDHILLNSTNGMPLLKQGQTLFSNDMAMDFLETHIKYEDVNAGIDDFHDPLLGPLF
ncbi:uncharacterized protein BYT42DRAFT_545250 [Radiomyces spectabilis]|uniref:uncharacterized protein n=1 Tax=Radiomyces spectabilis TaxID=64574 RepID=UPI0022203A1F|nr:uncharacterized protein BYT42DRAFT_545250 [Radiomyces spectabilis]KAI8381348.1 hypothetical protein BYT42DRAFT_545250 [Radiomyces spectabilis]